MYTPLVPEFQIFHCVEAPAFDEGGRTTFCDTTRVLADAGPATRVIWETIIATYRIQKAHYGGEAKSPLITAHPDRDFATLRYNEPVAEDEHDFINRQAVQFDGVPPEQILYIQHSLRETLYDPVISTSTHGKPATWSSPTTTPCCTTVRRSPAAHLDTCSACTSSATHHCAIRR
jgi:L-tyrosine isonitrile desaturase/decarboxylase